MRKKILLLPLLLLTLAGVSTNQTSNKARVLYADEMIDNVKIGDIIEVEPRTLTYEGENKTVQGQIILPDGTSKEGKQFSISMPGKYTVNYRAFFGTHEVSISQIYHCHRTSGDFFISNETSNKPQVGEYSHPIKNGEIKGAKLILDAKTTFTYDGIIDFSSYNQNDSFIELIVDTSKQSTSDLETFTIRLTDVENNNNYIDITVTDSGPVDDDGRGCYILAGSNNQFKTGYEGSRLHVSKYGANVGMSFRDLPEKGARTAKFYCNYLEKIFNVAPLLNEGGVKGKITDLDDKSIYGSNIWEGFTNGKAKLSIFANSLINSNATLIVTKVADHDLSPLDFVDESKPTITIDYEGQSTLTPPKASVNKPYKIFNAIISDNFDKDLSYSIYVTHYDSVNAKTKDVSIVNGCFTPKEEGIYRITYLAQDHSLNVAKKELNITTINDPQIMSLSLDIASISQELYSNFELPSISDVHVTGGSGKATITRTIYDSNNKEIAIDGNTFIPEKVGNYVVIYRAVDYIGNTAEISLQLTALDPGHPIFVGNVNLPRILIKEHEYSLPDYPGVEVINNETVNLNSKVYVNGSLLNNNKFIADSSCVVKYELTGSTGNETYLATIEVIEGGDPVNFANYFHGNFAKSVHSEDVELSASSGNASDLFASVLPYDNPYVRFVANEEESHYERLVFKFSDSLNPNNSLSFKVKFSLGKAYISIGNDSTEYEFTSAELNGEKSFAVDFDASTRVFRDINHNEITLVKFNDQGNAFAGFSGGVYLDISMEGILSHSSVKILTISNQVLGHLDMEHYYDFAQPIVILKNKFINEQEYGKQAYIPAADVFDVLSDATITMSVKAPNGSYKIQNQDGRKEHTFTLDQFGNYTVTYTAIDSAGNSANYRRKIVVYDFNAPELTIIGGIKESYKLNAEISIPSYKVSDNLNNYTLDVFLIMPNNEERVLLIDKNGFVTSYLDENSMIYNSSFKVNSTTFRAEQYGKYTMRFVAYDSDFNKTVKELHFEVK